MPSVRDDDYETPDRPRSPSPQSEGTGSGLGVAGMVLGIVSLLISFIPCLGMYAIFPAALALLLSGFGMAMASKKGISIAGVVISLCAVAVAGYQYYVANKLVDKGNEVLKDLKERFPEDTSKKEGTSKSTDGDLKKNRKDRDKPTKSDNKNDKVMDDDDEKPTKDKSKLKKDSKDDE